MTQPVFRFAPSPNGRLHLGHAYSALLNAELAGRSGGRFLLRIEDIDPARCRPEFEQAIYDDLAWLRLRWEEPVRRQSEHIVEYAARLDELKSRGLVFPCFCSRKAIAAAVSAREAETGAPWRRDPDGAPLYPGICRDLEAAEAGR
ncbi:MAG TPA: glutamate--tRNA ligase family protein, partial [Beijerinckiaceae bacterium]|nr:glutamate--tRNA ligase family protein [Beijerinckiaceae bacterium]